MRGFKDRRKDWGTPGKSDHHPIQRAIFNVSSCCDLVTLLSEIPSTCLLSPRTRRLQEIVGENSKPYKHPGLNLQSTFSFIYYVTVAISITS